jgi:sRNA-binding regulator protein Hfq
MMNKPSSGTINIQDPFFYQLRKDSKTVHIYLVSGKNHGQEQLVYKHAIASIAPISPFPGKAQPEEEQP